MRSFFWPIVICVASSLAALAVDSVAISRFLAGEGGIKLGVDLAGGTMLIYEVDVSRFAGQRPEDIDSATGLPKNWDAQLLADRLKKRIDPADLYNITIRAVSKTRVEIILPTGARRQVENETRIWDDLIHRVSEKWPPLNYGEVPVGRKIHLVVKINAQYPDTQEPKVSIKEIEKFIDDNYKPKEADKSGAAWKDLLLKVEGGFKITEASVASLRAAAVPEAVLAKLKPLTGEPFVAREEFTDALVKALTKEELDKSRDLILNNAAVEAKWPARTYVVARGHLEQLALEIRKQHPEVPEKEINDLLKPTGATGKDKRRHLSTEEVQHVKELIAQVGTLEFDIVANNNNDQAAIDVAAKELKDASKNQSLKDDLDRRAIAGMPPPPPGGGKKFPTDRGDYSYSWIELGAGFRRERGKEQRFTHGLVNPRTAQGKLLTKDQLEKLKKNQNPGVELENGWTEDALTIWAKAAVARENGETTTYKLGDNQVGLLYSRDVKNIRLADKDKDKLVEYFLLMRDPEDVAKKVTGEYLSNAKRGEANNINFTFKTEGGNLFREFTRKNIGQPMAIVLDGYVTSIANIKDAIGSEGQLSGNFTDEQIERTVNNLRSGALPGTLKPEPVSESTMGATLGADTIKAGTYSVGIAFAAILVFMLVYYRFAGLVACIALLSNLVLTVGFMVVVQATFTLPGLAGLVLMLAMAVDANVLIYERLREERDRGASLALAIRNGYDRAFPTIIDTHLSSIFTAIVLYVVGNDQLKGFGISLTVGLIISLFTSLYMTRTIFDIWQSKNWLHKLSMLRLFSRPNIDFMAIRYYWFTATIILTILGAALFVYHIPRGGLNIDFVGGTAYGGELNDFMEIQDLRDLLKDSGLPDQSVEQIFSPGYSKGTGSKLFSVRTSEKNAEYVQNQINKLLEKKNLLKKIELSYNKVAEDKEYDLSFIDPEKRKAGAENTMAFASRAKVGLLLSRKLKEKADEFKAESENAALSNQFDKAKKLEDEATDLHAAAQQYLLEGVGKDEDGRYQVMVLRFVKAVPPGQLEKVLEATKLEFSLRPQPERFENFDSQLAKDTQQRAFYAIVASWAAILLYLWFRFGSWTFGAATVLCLIHDLFFTLGIIAFCHYLHDWSPGLARFLLIQDFKIDLGTVAALLTLVGYSVSDTIVVFDRIREVRGKNPELTAKTINDSVNQTLSRTLLTSFSVFLVVIVLYIWGGEGIHLFAFVMVVGVVVGTYSSIYIASPLLLIFGEGKQASSVRERVQETASEPA